MGAEKAEPQSNCAKRMECVQLAGAVEVAGRSKSGSKLHALHRLRAKGGRERCSQLANVLGYCNVEEGHGIAGSALIAPLRFKFLAGFACHRVYIFHAAPRRLSDKLERIFTG